jgi:hypothetical protein
VIILFRICTLNLPCVFSSHYPFHVPYKRLDLYPVHEFIESRHVNLYISTLLRLSCDLVYIKSLILSSVLSRFQYLFLSRPRLVMELIESPQCVMETIHIVTIVPLPSVAIRSTLIYIPCLLCTLCLLVLKMSSFVCIFSLEQINIS